MAMAEYRAETFQKLREDGENLYCFDCKKEDAIYVSVSHGIFLCSYCADLHRTFGVHISFVKGVHDNNWTQKQLNIMRVGGNSAFRLFISKYPFPSTDVETVYRSRAAKAYRDMVKQLAEGSEWIDVECSLEEGALEYQEPVPAYAPPQEAQSSWKTYFTSALSSTKKLGDNLATKTKELISHPAVEELKDKTKSAIHSLGTKGKEFVDSPTVQTVTTSASDYFHAAKAKASETLQRINENPTVQRSRQNVMETLSSLGGKAADAIMHLSAPLPEEPRLERRATQ